jgi:hypothetical protein
MRPVPHRLRHTAGRSCCKPKSAAAHTDSHASSWPQPQRSLGRSQMSRLFPCPYRVLSYTTASSVRGRSCVYKPTSARSRQHTAYGRAEVQTSSWFHNGRRRSCLASTPCHYSSGLAQPPLWPPPLPTNLGRGRHRFGSEASLSARASSPCALVRLAIALTRRLGRDPMAGPPQGVPGRSRHRRRRSSSPEVAVPTSRTQSPPLRGQRRAQQPPPPEAPCGPGAAPRR